MKKIICLAFVLFFINYSYAALDVFVSEETFEVGYSKLLKITLENTGTQTVSDIEMSFVYLESPLSSSVCSECKVESAITSECIEYEDDCFKRYGSIDSGNSKDIFYSIQVPSTASPKSYLGKIFLKYYLGGQKEQLETFLVNVTDDTSFVFQNKRVSEVFPFGEFQLLFGLKNTEGYSLKNTEITFSESSSFFPKNSKIVVGDVSSGSTKNVNITMEATGDVIEGNNYVDLVMTWQNLEGSRQSYVERFNFVVGGETSFQVDVDDVYPTPVTTGIRTALSIGILNKGDFSASSAMVSIDNPAVLEPSRYYVGNIDANEYDTATFTISPNIAGSMELPVTITYFDVLGNFWEENHTVNLAVGMASINENQGNPMVYVFLVFFGAVLVYYFFFKKKKGKK